MGATIKWLGDEVGESAINAIVAGLTQFGLEHEREAKAPLRPNRGVVTGTYRRSIHSANPSYNFPSDNVKPSRTSPERGGTGGGAEVVRGKVVVTVGSGLVYASSVEARYSTLKSGHEKVLPELVPIIKKKMKEAGF